MKALSASALFFFSILPSLSAEEAPAIRALDGPLDLLDAELSQFEIWVGVPHATVKGLPEGTFQSRNVHKGRPIGFDRELKGIFTVQREGDEPVLRISGEIYAALSTLDAFANYHLSTQFRWGEKKWAPRLEKKRDSGILYHCYGEHARFWQVWKTSLEYQVQETDFGDFIPLAGNTAKPKKVPGPLVDIRGGQRQDREQFLPDQDEYFTPKGYVDASSEHDAPHGEWNLLEVFVLGNDAVHLINGHVVMVVENARQPDGTPLTSGPIQIQSEAAECYYKQLRLTPITEFPPSVLENVRFREP
ncbi:MAG: DUF1080 domain-containing protein [Verrucomicrobiota bacterium]